MRVQLLESDYQTLCFSRGPFGRKARECIIRGFGPFEILKALAQPQCLHRVASVKVHNGRGKHLPVLSRASVKEHGVPPKVDYLHGVLKVN